MPKGEFIFKFDPSKECRFGLLPRYATDESQIRWFKIPTCFMFHNGKLSRTRKWLPHFTSLNFLFHQSYLLSPQKFMNIKAALGTINPCIYYLCAANAWEEGDEVVLTTCRMPGIELDLELEYKKEKAWSVNSKL